MNQHVQCICGKVFDRAGTTQCPVCGASAASAVPVNEAGGAAPMPSPGRFSLGWAVANVVTLALAAVAAARFVTPDMVPVPQDIKKDDSLHHEQQGLLNEVIADNGNGRNGQNNHGGTSGTVVVDPHNPKTDPKSDPKPDPKPEVKHEAKHQWIVDAKGGGDSDGVDLAEVLEKAAANDKITLRHGIYPAALTVAKPIHLIGDTKGGPVAVTSPGVNKPCLMVLAKGVTVESINFTVGTNGSQPAVSVTGDGELQLQGCGIQSKSTIGLAGSGHAAITATGCTFSGIEGSAVDLDDQAHIQMTDCTFTHDTGGVIAANGAQATLQSCKFVEMGVANGGGSNLYARGEAASITAKKCDFMQCRTGMDILQKATLTLQDCTLADNGVLDKPNSWTMGLLKARDGGHVKITGTVFRANRQGLAAASAGTLDLDDCHFTGNGMATSNPALDFYCDNLAVSGPSTTATLRHCDFNGALRDTINVSQGATVILTDTDISSGEGDALNLGLGATLPPDANQKPAAGATAAAAAPCHAEVKQCHFTGNGFGIAAGAGSTLSVTGTTYLRQGTGLLIQDEGTHAQLEDVTISGSSDQALICQEGAEATAKNCTFEGNIRGVLLGVSKTPSAKSQFTMDTVKFASNGEYDATICPSCKLVLRDCTFGADGKGKPKVIRQKDGELDAQPSVELLADADSSGSGKKQSHSEPETSSKKKHSKSNTQRKSFSGFMDQFKKYIPH